MDVIGVLVGMFGSLKMWVMNGGPIWTVAMVLMAMMWLSRWSGNSELRWFTSLGCMVAFIACLILVLFGDSAHVNTVANWGMRWLYPLGGMFLFYVVENAKLVLHDGVKKKESAH